MGEQWELGPLRKCPPRVWLPTFTATAGALQSLAGPARLKSAKPSAGGCTITSVSEGRRVWRNTPVPHLKSTALTSSSMEAMPQRGQLQVLVRKGTCLGGYAGRWACRHVFRRQADLLPRAMSRYSHWQRGPYKCFLSVQRGPW